MDPPQSSTARFDKVSLRDELIFPTFHDSPDENDVDDRYYHVDWVTAVTRLRVHWCFLGEVDTIDWFVRLNLIVKDKSGERTHVRLHTEDRGARYARTVKKGQTVAILYANQHGFLDMSRGFRVEEPSTIKIIPCTLQALLAANDKLLQPLPETCWQDGCDQMQNLSKCSICHKAQYCGKEHQAAAWKGHKAECKAFAALAWFMEREWWDFEGFWDFDD